MTRRRAVVSWSGGKDSCLALMRRRDDLDVRVALTMFDGAGARSRSHGLRPDVVGAQVARLGLRPAIGRADWATYTDAFVDALRGLRAEGVDVCIFGDVFDDAHRRWSEEAAARAGMTADLPIWGEDTAALAREFLARGGRARIVTVRIPPLSRDWLGRDLCGADLDVLAAIGADPGGERGEYHTVVTGCPLFSSPVDLTAGVHVATGDCVAVDFSLSPGPARAAAGDREAR
jgi:uncharacterized protein (TIGR00290 family)